jgi:succinate-acetate transporter protein
MNSRARAVAISTVGYLFIAITFWMVSMTNAGWYSQLYSVSMLASIAIGLAIMGILAFVAGRGLDSGVFFGAGALLGSVASYVAVATNVRVTYPLTYLGWFASMFGIYFLCLWGASLRSGMTRSGFLLTLWLALGCMAIGGWSGVGGWAIAGGYLGLISACFAFVTAGTEIVRFGRVANPNQDVAPIARPMAAD